MDQTSLQVGLGTGGILLKTVGSYEAKTHLPALLDEIAEGRQVVITRKGVPVALLSPYPTENPMTESVIAALLASRKKMKLKGLSVSDLKAEGRR